jgi:hypothetical protein
MMQYSLLFSDSYQAVVKSYRHQVEAALADVLDHCNKNSWICDINCFCVEWDASKLSQLKDAPPYVMEVGLNWNLSEVN